MGLTVIEGDHSHLRTTAEVQEFIETSELAGHAEFRVISTRKAYHLGLAATVLKSEGGPSFFVNEMSHIKDDQGRPLPKGLTGVFIIIPDTPPNWSSDHLLSIAAYGSQADKNRRFFTGSGRHIENIINSMTSAARLEQARRYREHFGLG